MEKIVIYSMNEVQRLTSVNHINIFTVCSLYTYTMIRKEDIITTDGYLRAFPNDYFKVDVIVSRSSIHWRGRLHHPPTVRRTILITGHGDMGITDNLVRAYSPKLWWTTNKETTDPRVHSLPLGITNDCLDTPIHPIFGNLDIMVDGMGTPRHIKNRVYMNFNTHTYPVEREGVYTYFKNKEWVTCGTIVNTLEGRKAFLNDIRNHEFVLCPRGGGVDTHRLWETLYMGSIPIVRRDIAIQDFSDLPICFIDDWDQVTPDFLDSELKRIKNGVFNMDKLKISYWIQSIQDSVRT